MHFTIAPHNLLLIGIVFASASLRPIAKHIPHAIGPNTELIIQNKIIAPDGFQRTAVLAGDTYPGPILKGSKGDTFRINVVNRLTNSTMLKSTSVHWHGISQVNSAWADGASFVTQCPIAQNHSFLYEFKVLNQAGTFWYHSHIATQYCDGLRGAFVVYDPADPFADLYDVDNESTVITLSDWYRDPAPLILITATPSATLINGVGRSADGPLVPLSVVNVAWGKRYRFRMIATSCYSRFNFSIASHRLTVIEADGVNLEPLITDSIPIFPGQRYSFILHANQRIDNYWIRANTDRGPAGFVNGINSAILRYVGAAPHEPKNESTFNAKGFYQLREVDLHPLRKVAAFGLPHVGGADVAININMTFDPERFLGLMNGVAWESPKVPVLLQILSGARTAQELLPAGSFYSLPRDKVIEISVPGGLLDGPHPFHLHGHHFQVIRSSGSDKYNFKDPISRDVVSLGDLGDNVTIRFVTDNPGPWIYHCHIDWHFSLGLAIVFAENTPDIPRLKLPTAWKDLCSIYDSLQSDQL